MQRLQTIVAPRHIDTSHKFWSTFGKYETEVWAHRLVTLAQQNGDWRDFTQAELDQLGGQDFHFNGLLKTGFILDNRDGSFSFTDAFINQCYGKNWVKHS